MAETHPRTPTDNVRARLREWFAESPGQLLNRMELDLLGDILSCVFGYHLLQVGYIGWRTEALATSRVRNHVVLDEGAGCSDAVKVRASPGALPIASDSVDALVLVHTLEFESEPHQVLREADRVLIPEGHLVVFTFNPWSPCGLWRLFGTKSKRVPWCGQFLSQMRLRDWFALLGFEVEASHGLLYRPPLKNLTAMEKLAFMERLGQRWWPFMAGVHVTVARKRVSRLTPIRPRWRPHRSIKAAGLAEPTTRLAENE